MSKPGALIASLVLMSSFAAGLTAADGKVADDGFIRDWLVLAPFALPEDMGSDEIDKKQIAGEGDLKPKAGDKQKVGDKEGTWKAATAKEYNLDLHEVLGARNEDALAYLVTYVVADKELPGLIMGVGSNDQAKIWVNGKEVHKFSDTRAIEQDSDQVPGVTLKAGVNVIVFKVINQKNDWAAALRFLEKPGKPVTGLVVKTAP
jgi:hypothetical protein